MTVAPTLPEAISPVVYAHPGQGYRAAVVIVWHVGGAPEIGAFGEGCHPEWFDAYRVAEALAATARAKLEAEHAAALGELLETLPNGLELRRKVSADWGVSLGLYDPAPTRPGGPWRGIAHNRWSNRKGEPRWLLSQGSRTCGQIRTEAEARRKLIAGADRS